MAARVIGALLFVAGFGFFVAQPVLRSEGGKPAGPTVVPSVTPSESPGETSERKTVRRLVHGYPRACLRRVPVTASDSLIAAFNKDRVTIVTPSGEVRAKIEDVAPTVKPPIAWSPSGRVLAVGPQGLFWTSGGTPIPIGDVQHGMVVGARGRWAWSPIADCGVQIDEDGALQVTAVDPNTTAPGRLAVGAGIPLVHPTVETFAFSPDGTKLGLVVLETGRRSIWITDLVKNRMHEVSHFPSKTCCISLGGWTPSGDRLLFWAGPGSSVMADGWMLQSVSIEGEVNDLVGMRVNQEFLTRCGNDLIGIIGGDRFDVGLMRLGELRAGQPPAFLTERRQSYLSASCSANGNFIAAIRGAVVRGPRQTLRGHLPTSLVILDRDGSVSTLLTPAGVSDAAAEFGPMGSGVVFVRQTRGAAEVWFAPEGAAPNPVGLSLGVPHPQYVFVPWTRVLDWSATPPTGLPAG